ncbi:MAG: hypothetical protein PHV78_00160 [Patescibacteria group bacterium]|nr:hypothetical protein [Patescibacteria group bacterium]MDD5121409.1 hypothetical protein [Patescibacteria group bacterium]MDD5221865.1 hypothetical protein [Patescibacteria group bacterium]MDD5395672.1 hypothetical protein [Patescibacteria group bacterium]
MITEVRNKDSDKIVVSKQKWIIVGLLVTILNPFFAGLIYGYALWREPGLKNDGKWLMILSLFWGAISMALVLKYYY